MNAKKTDALVDVIRAIIGPSNRNLSKDQIIALLMAAGNDPNKAVDLYFQAEAANGAEFKQNDVEGDVDDDDSDAAWPPQATELSNLLGGEVKKQIIVDLLRRTGGNLHKAVEIYFVEHAADDAHADDVDDDESSDDDDDHSGSSAAALKHSSLAGATSHVLPPAHRTSLPPAEPAPSSAELPPASSAVTPIAAQVLEPLHPLAVAPVAVAAPTSESDVTAQSSVDAAAAAVHGPATYEVVVTASDLAWQIGTVFGRAVVQAVDSTGAAAAAGVHKSDVLLAVGDTVVTDKNCAAIVQQLLTDQVRVPTTLRFRRAPESSVHHKDHHFVPAGAALTAGAATPAATTPVLHNNTSDASLAAATADTSVAAEPTDEASDVVAAVVAVVNGVAASASPSPSASSPSVAAADHPVVVTCTASVDIDIDDVRDEHYATITTIAPPAVDMPSVPEGNEQPGTSLPPPLPAPAVVAFDAPSALATITAAATPAPVTSDDSDVEMTEVLDEPLDESLPSVDPKYGLQTLCRAVESMVDAIGDASVELKVIVDLLLLAEFSLDRAVNNFLNEDRLSSDFRRVVGHDWDPAHPTKCWGNDVYYASIPAGPLGLTVENILERTIVVDIKPGGAAERAAVKRSSWLVALNGVEITRLTHKETLRMIETAERPLQLTLLVVPPDEYKVLRKQLSMNIRQQKTERPVPEQDRMSFRVFQLKIHQAVLVFPKAVIAALFQYLSTEEYHPPTLDRTYVNPLDRFLATSDDWERTLLRETRQLDEERSGEMSTERRFLLNLFSQIHEYDDKGESTVIRTIQFLGWLAKRAAELQQHVAKAPHVSNTIGLYDQRYTLLLSVVLHVLESLSIIENHATWDVMVNAFKMVIQSLADRDVGALVVPMMARHSISSSPTARIAPISLVAMVYPRVDGDVPVQLRGMFERMCSDDNPLVRRAVTSVIADLAVAAGTSAAAWTVQLLEKATADTHDIVRIFAVKNCLQLANHVRGLLRARPSADAEEMLRLLFVQLVPMVNTYASDSSWQVRLETARTLPMFCCAFGAEYTDIFVDHYVAMVRDPTVEVRKACAESGFALGEALVALALRQDKVEAAKATAAAAKDTTTTTLASPKEIDIDIDELEPSSSDSNGIVNLSAAVSNTSATDDGNSNDGDVTVVVTELDRLSLAHTTSAFVAAAQDKIMRSVLPATYRLATDVSVAVRQALAKTVGQSLQLVSAKHYDDLVPIFAELLDDNQDAGVRAALLEEVVRFFDSASEPMASMIFPEIHALLASPQWRVRVKFVQCIGSWAARTDGAVVPLEFADGCLELLLDPVHDVRATACRTLPVLVHSLGHTWLADKVAPQLAACLQSTFHGRVTALAALELLAPELRASEKLRDAIASVVAECTSRTANLRFRALRTLGVLVPVLNDPSTTENTLEIVWDLVRPDRETDPDVREAAEATQVLLEALTT